MTLHTTQNSDKISVKSASTKTERNQIFHCEIIPMFQSLNPQRLILTRGKIPEDKLSQHGVIVELMSMPTKPTIQLSSFSLHAV